MGGAETVPSSLDERVAAVRRFNRFYTKQIGLLQQGYLASPFSLTEVRVLYELAHRDGPTAAELGKELGLDAGYLSRILRSFEEQGLIQRTPSDADGRQHVLTLTRKGQREVAGLQERSRRDIAAMLGRLPDADQGRLVAAMGRIRALLAAPATARPAPYILRPHQVGDMGWVVHRHGVLYSQEYGWDERFEALVAGIVADFIKRFDPKRERCWIAERDGQNVGSVFLVRKSKTVAQLRLLLVEPQARGLGLGTRLVEECLRFARQAGYGEVTLWTNSVLVAARRIYERAGFRLVHEEPHRSFGQDLVGQTWELTL
jgi:DNA-binding MarR family transcriptional regulator/N-acetylglutamate synthase-like GNAT family acetyltransferase